MPCAVSVQPRAAQRHFDCYVLMSGLAWSRRLRYVEAETKIRGGRNGQDDRWRQKLVTGNPSTAERHTSGAEARANRSSSCRAWHNWLFERLRGLWRGIDCPSAT